MAAEREPGEAGHGQRRQARELLGSLTPAELQLVRFATAGHSLLQIAGRLGMLLEDAAMLKVATMKKLGAAHTADLVRLGVHAGIDRDPPGAAFGRAANDAADATFARDPADKHDSVTWPRSDKQGDPP
jgi:DNA-binding CsgD family transcriptional regulator